MKLLIDMDNTLCDFVAPMCDAYNSIRNTNIRPEQITTFKMTDLGVDEDCMVEIMNTISFYEHLPPLEDAIKVFNDLSKVHDIRIVTAAPTRAPRSFESKVRWLNKHLPNFDQHNLIVTHDKHSVAGDVVIDDALHNILSKSTNACNRRGAVLLDWPHNRNVELPAWVFRAFSWKEIPKAIDLIDEWF